MSPQYEESGQDEHRAFVAQRGAVGQGLHGLPAAEFAEQILMRPAKSVKLIVRGILLRSDRAPIGVDAPRIHPISPILGPCAARRIAKTSPCTSPSPGRSGASATVK
jgi:hypothetical protein